MRRSRFDNSTWSFHSNGNANYTNFWPELCQDSQAKHPARKRDFVNIDNNTTLILDNLEYPELSCNTPVKNKSLVPRGHFLSGPSVQILVPVQTSVEPTKSKSLNRYKRSERISINIQEALENTRCIHKMTNKEVPKLKIDIYSRNVPIAGPSTIEDSLSSLGMVRPCISKEKKPSRLKKFILTNRAVRAHINVQMREAFEQAKMDAICRDVNAINFNALKITTDPEIHVDHVRRLCTMSLHEKRYRNTRELNICDDTLTHRLDIIEKINNLKIQGGQLTNGLIGNSNSTSCPQLKTEPFDNDIIEQTLSLQIKEDIKQEVRDSTEVDNKDFFKFSRNFREYCTNVLTPCLNRTLEKFLQEITRLQTRYHQKNPNKSKYKRRYYSGLKEVRKHADLKKLKFVIIAPDIEKVELKDGLDDEINKLIDTCKRHSIVFCFGLRRRKLGYYTHGKGFVGCIGIANYSGTEPLFMSVLTELVHARNVFKKHNGGGDATIDTSKVISEDNLPSENIGALLKALSYYAQS